MRNLFLQNSYRRSVTIAALAVAATGCATLLEGTSQEILVSTNPSGASCTLERLGQVIGTINSTPASAIVKRRKEDITVRCKKDGFEDAVYVNDSGLASGAVAGNVAADLILTAGLSSIVDSASGADNQYEGTVNLTMIPKGAVAPASAPTATMAPIGDTKDAKPASTKAPTTTTAPAATSKPAAETPATKP